MIGAGSTVIFHFDIKLADGSAAEREPKADRGGDPSLP